MFRSKKLVILVAGAAAALAVGSFAFAAVPDGNGDIHACYNKDSGALRVTDTATNKPKACTDKEQPLDWSQRGGGDAYALDVAQRTGSCEHAHEGRRAHLAAGEVRPLGEAVAHRGRPEHPADRRPLLARRLQQQRRQLRTTRTARSRRTRTEASEARASWRR